MRASTNMRALNWWLAMAVVASVAGCRRDGPAKDPVVAAAVTEPAPPSPAVAVKAAATTVPQRLMAEFAGAYPSEAAKPQRTRDYELIAAPTVVQQLDGRPLQVWAYNGQVPAQVLRVRLGEELHVTLRNQLPQPTTIHWHGVRVPNAMDGVPGLTQPAVEPGASFEYRFTPKDAGTFWFHPHVRGSEQVERGLYGVLVVDDAEPLPYSRDEVWVLDDWRLGPDGQIDPNFVTRHDLAHDGRWGQEITVNGSSTEELVVRPGERLRLRLVNTSNGRVYRPDFSGLDAQVIAVDGMYTQHPVAPDGFELAPGNRLDLDISIAPSLRGRSIQVVDRFTRQPHTLATIRVEDVGPVTPESFKPPSNPRVPAWSEAAATPVDVTYVLNASQGGPHGIQWTINGKPWAEHEITELQGGQWTRLRFRNASFRLHPMHLHGQFFKVLARNGEPADEPYFRDTVLVHRQETVDVGLVPIDWGRWMMHCHILEHADSGMMTSIRVNEPVKE